MRSQDHYLDIVSTKQKEDEEKNRKEMCYLEGLASYL